MENTFGYTLPYMAKDVHEVIEKLHLQKTFMIGWSMGGSIVFEYFRQFGSQHIKGIVIVDIGPYSWKTDDYPNGYMNYKRCLRLTRKYTMAYQVPGREKEGFIEKMFVRKAGTHTQ